MKDHLAINCKKGAVFCFGWGFLFVCGWLVVVWFLVCVVVFVVFFFFKFPSSSFISFHYERMFLLTLSLVCLHALLVPKGMEDFQH